MHVGKATINVFYDFAVSWPSPSANSGGSADRLNVESYICFLPLNWRPLTVDKNTKRLLCLSYLVAVVFLAPTHVAHSWLINVRQKCSL